MLACVGFLCFAVAALAAEPPAEASFPMKEARPDLARADTFSLLRGQAVILQTAPPAEVKAWPKLRSKRPLYGTAHFDRDLQNPVGGITMHFVLDESGETPISPSAKLEPAEKAKPGESLARGLAALLSGKSAASPAKPEKKPPKPSTYDRLYLDRNRDLDLTNDPPLKPFAGPLPALATIPQWEIPQWTVFEWLDLPIDYGPPVGVRPFRVLPRFILHENDYAVLYFVASTCREGRIQIGSQKYNAVLAQRYLISGRFDRPMTGLLLTGGTGQQEYWWGNDELCAVRRVDGQLYTLRATPLGDRLTVAPYQGKSGVFRLGAGGRKLDKMTVTGSLRSPSAAVGLAESATADGMARYVSETKLPVGDYLPTYITLEYGRLRISISDNYHSDGKPRDSDRRRTFGIAIREDRPYVFDFSNKPEVMFASPAKGQSFKPGDEVSVKGVLIDPKLDIMIRNLDDMKTTRKQTVKYGNREETIERQASLDPLVTITNSAGKKVSEGPMPFG